MDDVHIFQSLGNKIPAYHEQNKQFFPRDSIPGQLKFVIMSKRKAPTAIALKTKLEIIQTYEAGGISQAELGRKYGLGRSTIKNIINDKVKVIDKFASGNTNVNAKRIRPARMEDVEDELLTWFNDVRNSNVPISGIILMEKAKSIAQSLGFSESEFAASNGWLWRFQKRHGISSLVICGELNKVNNENVEEWLKTFEKLREKYAPRNVFNMDESGIFFNLLPDRTLDFKGKKCHGGAKSKERITSVFVVNWDGSEKLPVWVIGKSKNPRAFKNIKVSDLPCTYTYQTNAWINSFEFRKWLVSFNLKMVAKKTTHPPDNGQLFSP